MIKLCTVAALLALSSLTSAPARAESDDSDCGDEVSDRIYCQCQVPAQCGAPPAPPAIVRVYADGCFLERDARGSVDLYCPIGVRENVCLVGIAPRE